MKRYQFDLLETENLFFEEKDHVILAYSLSDALAKFSRKHDLECPAYWDEPVYDVSMEITFKDSLGERIKYLVSW
jgi:hypothetical protein